MPVGIFAIHDEKAVDIGLGGLKEKNFECARILESPSIMKCI